MAIRLPFQLLLQINVGESATPSPGLSLTLNPYLIMLSVKQGDIKNLFMNCLYDLTWNWTPVSPTISQHSDHYALIYTYIKYTYLYIYICWCHQLYGDLPPITKTIQVRRTRQAGHCWRSKDELISDVLLWTLTYGQAKAGWPVWTYIQQLCEDTGCNPEDLQEAMNYR